MKELRIDKITGDMIIFAADRIKRPHDKKLNQDDELQKLNEYEEYCPFCRGNEELTTDSTFEIRRDGKWTAKSVLNKFPIIDNDSTEIFGKHEVMVETFRHDGSFYNMDEIEFKDMFTMYANRYKSLINEDGVKYVNIFKNFLRKAGASLTHPHSQIISMSIVPPEIQNEIDIAHKYFIENGRSLYQDVIEEEIEYSNRIIYNGKTFLIIVPYATKYSGEIRIIFKKSDRIDYLLEEVLDEISEVFKKLFENVYNVNGYMPFNLCVHAEPSDMDSSKYFNPHIHIIPRRFNFGGFELGSDVHVSSIDADEMAASLKINK